MSWTSDVLVQVADNIQKTGFHVTGVFATQPGEPTFAYTTGFYLQGHSEIIIAGLNPEQYMPTFHNIYRIIQEEGACVPDVPDDRILHDFSVMYVPSPEGKQLSRVTSAYLQHKNFQVLQMFYPDIKGRFPWEEGYSLPESLQKLQVGS